MARFGVIGDLHGNHKWANHVLNELGKRKISHAFVVGDFGYWPGFSGIQYLDRLQASAENNNLSILAIPGNHDWYDGLETIAKIAPTHKGFYYLRERVLLSPKANAFKLFGKSFVVAGGAVSIDKAWRLANERGGKIYNKTYGYHEDFGSGTGERTLWWPQEQLTDDEENLIKSYGKCDILLTHDQSNHTLWKNRLKPDLDSQLHRERIDRIISAVKPHVHFAGHFHEKYEWLNTRSHGFYDENEPDAYGTKTYGLACDGMPDSWLIYDTDTDEVAWEGGGMSFRSLAPADS